MSLKYKKKLSLSHYLNFLVPFLFVLEGGTQEFKSKAPATYLVVGAGASGLASVEALVENGVDPKKIIVVEKALMPGGKISSIPLGSKNFYFEQGAQMIIPGAYPLVEKLAKDFGVTTVDLPRGFAIDIRTGNQGSIISADQYPELGKQIGRYLQLYSEKWHQEASGGQYRLLDNDGMAFSHPELRGKSWYQFVKENNFELLDKALLTILGGTGSSFELVNSTAAAKVLRALNPSLIKSLFIDKRAVMTFPSRGFQELMLKWAEKHRDQGVQFSYGTQVVSIDLENPIKNTLVRLDNGKVISFKSENVIYAANPNQIPIIVKNAKSYGLEIYNDVQANDYRVFHYEVEGLEILKGKAGSFALLPTILGGDQPGAPFPVGEPIMIVKPFTDIDIVMISAHGAEGVSDESIEKKITMLLKALNATGRKLDLKKWDHYRFKFPVLNHESYVKAALGQQGKAGFSVVGEVLSFGGVESVIEFAKNSVRALVQKSSFLSCRTSVSQ